MSSPSSRCRARPPSSCSGSRAPSAPARPSRSAPRAASSRASRPRRPAGRPTLAGRLGPSSSPTSASPVSAWPAAGLGRVAGPARARPRAAGSSPRSPIRPHPPTRCGRAGGGAPPPPTSSRRGRGRAVQARRPAAGRGLPAVLHRRARGRGACSTRSALPRARGAGPAAGRRGPGAARRRGGRAHRRLPAGRRRHRAARHRGRRARGGWPAPLRRLHSECFTGDLLGSLRCDCGAQLRGAIAPDGRGGRAACCSTWRRKAAASASSTSCAPTRCRTAGSTRWTPTAPRLRADERNYVVAATMLRAPRHRAGAAADQQPGQAAPARRLRHRGRRPRAARLRAQRAQRRLPR